MTLRVLQNRAQIRAARNELEHEGLSSLPPASRRWLSLLRLGTRLPVGDWLKSWDVGLTRAFLEEKLDKDAAVMDMGCFCSEVLPVLHKSGFTRLTGLDLNQRITEMPHGESIDYRCENFLSSSLEDGSQQAITSISVMEHGFVQDQLLDELDRLLMPGGYYLASFDYWPQKIDTGDVRFFDMSWTLFCEGEVRAFLDAAASRGLYPVSDIEFAASTTPIKCAGFKYTFAWLALRKQG